MHARLVFAAVLPLLSAAPAGTAGTVVQSTMPSKVLGEERQVIVHVPASYADHRDRRYPVVYVLDGTSQDGHTAETAARLAREGVMPEVIVVGLPNTRDNRNRDYTPPFMRLDVEKPDSPRGAGDRFLSFMKTELIPAIERDYRTTPFRILAGNSRGGLLVVYSLLADPALFDARFAFSTPLWREDDVTVSKLGELLTSRPDLNTCLYMSVGERENANIVGAFERTIVTMTRQASKAFGWRADRTKDADHSNNAQVSTAEAFTFLYTSCKPRRQC